MVDGAVNTKDSRYATPFQKTIFGVAVVLTLLIIIGLSLLAKPMYPITTGTSAAFWSNTVGISLRSATDYGGVGCFDGEYAYYMPDSMDALWTYRVAKAEVMRDYPEVLRQSEERAAAPATEDPAVAGYRRWLQLNASDRTPDQLIACFDDAWTARILAKPDSYPGGGVFVAQRQNLMYQHISKSERYWANFVFELTYLCGLVWFTAWPFLKNKSLISRLSRLAVAPTFLFLPGWLGYCSICAGGVGPAGGILYPWLVWITRPVGFSGYSSWELDLIGWLPKILDPLNQCPAFSLDSATREKIPATCFVNGPASAWITGAFLCGLLLLFRACRRIVGQWIPQRTPKSYGFEVLPTKQRAE